ncbi:hypothetical protein D3C74_159890 [compost metagenome]
MNTSEGLEVTTDSVPIYLRIRRYLLLNNIIFKDVAMKSGIKPNRLYRLLDGTYALEAEELEAICVKGLGINPSYFFAHQFSKIENCSQKELYGKPV